MATFKLIKRPKSAKFLHDAVREEVAKEIQKVARVSEASRKRVVANWENKPDFESKVIVTERTIRVVTRLKRPKRLKNGSANTNDLWKWLDQTGTRAHTITPKQQGGVLQFQAGKYQSKTGANPARHGGPGTVQNPQQVFTKQVEHPGFPARHFSEAINRDLKKDFDNAVRNGYRRGFKKVSGR